MCVRYNISVYYRLFCMTQSNPNIDLVIFFSLCVYKTKLKQTLKYIYDLKQPFNLMLDVVVLNNTMS